MATPRFVARFSHSENSTGGSFSFRLKGNEGSNHALVVRLYNRGNLASPTVTYNGDTVTQTARNGSGTDNNARWAGIYVLPAPDLDGNYSLSVSWGSGLAANWHVIAEHWCDVDQSTPTGTPASTNGGGTSSSRTGSSVTVSAAVGDMVIDAVSAMDSMTAGSGQTRGPQYPTPGSRGSHEEAGSTSVTMDWTWATTTSRLGHVGVALKGAGSASSPTLADRSGAKGNKSYILGTRVTAETLATGATTYVPIGISPESGNSPGVKETPWLYAGDVGLIGIRVSANATTSASTMTLVEDGVDTSTTVTIPAGTTGMFVSSTPLSVDGTSSLYWKLVNGGGGTLSWTAVWMTFEPSGSDTVSLLSSFGAGSWTKPGGTTEYTPAHGLRAPSTTISQSTFWAPFDGTLRNLYVAQTNQTRDFSSTIDTLIDAATTAFSITWGSTDGSQGLDTSSESLTQGERVQHRLTTAAGTGNFEIERLAINLESTAGHFISSTARGGGGLTLTNATDLFLNVSGELASTTTESAAQWEVPFDMTAIRLWVDVQTNAQGGTSGDDAAFTLRVNGVDTVLSVRIPRGDPVRVYSDFVTGVDLEAGDLINFKARTNVASGSLIINSIGIVGVSAGSAPSLPALSLSTYKPGTLTSSGWTPRVTAT